MSQDAVADHVLALEERRWDALVAADVDTLRGMMDERLVYTHANALVDGKASYLHGVASGAYNYQAVRRSDVRCTAYDGLAVVTGAADILVEAAGKSLTVLSRYTVVWAGTGDTWRVVAWHSCPRPSVD